MEKRKVDVLVISDVHLGTYGSRAKELLSYLKSVDIGMLILNGDIIDMWQFKKWYWPKSHMKVVKRIFKLLGDETPVYYITGNHDEMLRKFVDAELGSLKIVNHLILNLDDRKHWIFHGDVFDVTMKHSKWLAKLGGWGYDMLILINSLINFISEKLLGRGRISLSKKIKNSVKSAVSFIGDFERVTAEIAIDKGYDAVLCGHIHQPVIKPIRNDKGSVIYMNSGDWIENLSALEYSGGKWSLYRYDQAKLHDEEEVDVEESNQKELHKLLLEEFQIHLS